MSSVTVYDGGETIGGNKILVEEDGKGVFLDFGTNFSRYGGHIAEFLFERRRGIHDLIHLGLVPRLDVYRPDLTPLDLHTFTFYRPEAKAVLLSHAHLDHSGNVGLLRFDLPVVASSETVALLKAVSDLAPPDPGSEAFCSARRRHVDREGLILSPDPGAPMVCRDFFCTEDPPDPLVEFASVVPGAGMPGKAVEPGAISGLEDLELPFEIEARRVDHSACGACGYIVRGDTSVAYTGDLRAHGKGGHRTWEFAREARQAGVLIIEGTCAGKGEGGCVTEEDVYGNCLTAVEETVGLVVAGFSATDPERLDSFLRIAGKTGRELVVTKKDAHLLRALSCAGCGWAGEAGRKVSVYEEPGPEPSGEWGTLDSRGGEAVGFREVRSDPGRYILCSSFHNLKSLLDIRPEGGTYIYSPSEEGSEEGAIDLVRLGRWLSLFRLTVLGIKAEGTPGGGVCLTLDRRYHASGHADETDLQRVIDLVDPDVLIPVHTESPEWFIGKARKVVLPKEGERIVVG